MVIYFIFKDHQHNTSFYLMLFKNIFILGLSLIIGYLLHATYLEYRYFHDKKTSSSLKVPVYTELSIDTARTIAIQSNKKLLIDFTAPWCSSCKVVGEKFFSTNSPVLFQLQDYVIPVIFQWSDSNPQAVEFFKEYSINGLPMILVINPATGDLCGQFDSRITNWTQDEFIAAIIDSCNNDSIQAKEEEE